MRLAKKLASLFYADGILLEYPQPARFQDALDMLTGLLERVGLRTNMANTVGMVYQLCHYTGSQLTDAYTRQIKGEVPTYLERQRERVRFPDCGVDLETYLLVTHHHKNHGRGKEHQREESLPHTEEYKTSFLQMAGKVAYPVEGFRGGGDE